MKACCMALHRVEVKNSLCGSGGQLSGHCEVEGGAGSRGSGGCNPLPHFVMPHQGARLQILSCPVCTQHVSKTKSAEVSVSDRSSWE